MILFFPWNHTCSDLSHDELPKVDLGFFVCLAEELSCQWISREAQASVTSAFQKTKPLMNISVGYSFIISSSLKPPHVMNVFPSPMVL